MWRVLLSIAAVLILAGVTTLLWQQRTYRTTPAASAARTETLVMSNLHPGGAPAADLPPPAHTHEELSGFDVSEGKRWFRWFNCHGCHANGGGGIGPPLMDDEWLYGAEPRNIFATIVEGRPNGMPSFRGKIPDAQVWQIVAYVRSMSGQTPATARAGRPDDMRAKEPETLSPERQPVSGGSPAPDRRSTTP